MSTFFNRISGSLTAKLVMVLGLLILLGGGLFWHISVRIDENNLMENTVEFVSSFSEVVKRSLRHDMLSVHREGIQSTIETIGASEAIEGMRIYDSRGVVYYASSPDEIGRREDRGSAACIGCHGPGAVPREAIDGDKRWTIFEDPAGYRVLGFIEPIYNEPDCFSAACHAHDPAQKVLGILYTDFSLQSIDLRLEQQMVDISVYILSFLAASLMVLSLVLWRFVLRPVSGLSKGIDSVAEGDLAHKVPVMSADEMGRLAMSFNSMTGEIQAARLKMEDWTQSLEDEVKKKTEEIRRTQDKLVQAEKLAALGRLTADIAHEIRNPLTALGGFGRRLQRLVKGEKEAEYASIIVSETDRLELILKDVLTFSRDARFNLERSSVNDAVEESLHAYSPVLREHSVEVEVDFGTDLRVLIDKGQVRQAVDNLVSNAVDAMPEGGTLRVSTAAEEFNAITYVAIHVSDTGSGIPPDNLPLIFEPFFTTKNIGQGTGLGLSISRKIMEEMGGFLRAENRETGGVTMSLYFPYQSEEESSKVPCWTYMKCGRDKDNVMKCPAYPDFGRVCWVVAGTFCEGKVQGTFAQKCEDCRKCEFFKKVQAGEV